MSSTTAVPVSLADRLSAAKAASLRLATATTEQKNSALRAIASGVVAAEQAVLAANELDLANGRENGLSAGLLDRLTLSPARLRALSDAVLEVVALTAGLGVATFVKAFGVGFLARPRSAAATGASESPLSMRVGMGLAAAACTALALAPAVAGAPLGRLLDVLPSVRDGAPLAGSDVSLRLAGIAGSMSPLLIVVGLLVAGLGAAALVRRLTRRAPRRATPVWGGGSTRLTPRMEYTATSFAEPLTRVFDDVLRPEQDVDVTPFAESEFLIASISYRQRVPDRVEARLYPPLLAAARWWGRWSRGIANGSVHRYLAYGFVGLLVVLVVVGITS